MSAIGCPECRKALREGRTADGDLILACEGCLAGYVIGAGIARSHVYAEIRSQTARFHGKADERNSQAVSSGSLRRDYTRSANGATQLNRWR